MNFRNIQPFILAPVFILERDRIIKADPISYMRIELFIWSTVSKELFHDLTFLAK